METELDKVEKTSTETEPTPAPVVLERNDKGQLLPGQPSLNPAGRPKGLSITEAMQDYYRKHPEEWAKLIREMRADRRLRKEMWHYFDGMPKQKINLGMDAEDATTLTDFFRSLANPHNDTAGS